MRQSELAKVMLPSAVNRETGNNTEPQRHHYWAPDSRVYTKHCVEGRGELVVQFSDAAFIANLRPFKENAKVPQFSV